MRALIEEGTETNARHMQELALAEGAFPKHLLTALFTDITPGARGVDRKMLASRLEFIMINHCLMIIGDYPGYEEKEFS